MGRRFKIKGRRVIDTDEVARAKYLNARRIKGSDFVLADKALETRTTTREPKK